MQKEPLRIRIPATVFEGHIRLPGGGGGGTVLPRGREFTLKPGSPIELPENASVKRIIVSSDADDNLFLDFEE